MKISAKTKEHPEVSVDVNLPTDVAQAVNTYGAEAVFHAVNSKILFDIQGIIRRNIDKPHAEITKLVKEYKLSAKSRKPRKSPQQKALDLLTTLTPEQRKAVLSQLGK